MGDGEIFQLLKRCCQSLKWDPTTIQGLQKKQETISEIISAVQQVLFHGNCMQLEVDKIYLMRIMETAVNIENINT